MQLKKTHNNRHRQATGKYGTEKLDFDKWKPKCKVTKKMHHLESQIHWPSMSGTDLLKFHVILEIPWPWEPCKYYNPSILIWFNSSFFANKPSMIPFNLDIDMTLAGIYIFFRWEAMQMCYIRSNSNVLTCTMFIMCLLWPFTWMRHAYKKSCFFFM